MIELDREELDYCKMIYREIVGEITDEEKRALDDWINDSPCNSELYARFACRNAVMKRLHTYSQIPVDTYLSQFAYRIREIGKSRTINPQHRKVIPWIAVLIAFLCAGGVLFDSFRATFSAEIPTEEEIIHPGSAKALLVLDDKTIIQLSQDMEGYLISGGCIKNNSIDYTDTETRHVALHKIMVPTGGEYLAVLSDGSRIYLNSESVLEYPVSFEGDSREVRFEGEGYFEVAHDPQKSFIVHSKDVTVTALGTEFSIRAYADENYTAATLISGEVQVTAPHTDPVLLSPSQQAVSITGSGRITLTEVDARAYTGLKDGQFVFCEARLEDIINTIRRWYDFESVFDTRAKDLRFSGRINRRQSVYSFFNILEATGRIRVTVADKVITFTLN